jgi:hypothetical protein
MEEALEFILVAEFKLENQNARHDNGKTMALCIDNRDNKIDNRIDNRKI